MKRLGALIASLACASILVRGQAPAPPAYVTTGLFIASIEEGGRIFTPVRFLPDTHPEAAGHQFPTVLRLHRGEDHLLVLLGRHAGLLLGATLQRYPAQPDTEWPYAPFVAPPAGAFDSVAPIVRPSREAPLPGLRAVACLDRFPLAFIVDTRGLTLAERHMTAPTTMGLDVTRAQFLDALARAAATAPAAGAAIVVYQRRVPPGSDEQPCASNRLVPRRPWSRSSFAATALTHAAAVP